MQVTPFLTQIHVKDSKNTSRKQPVCQCFVHHTIVIDVNRHRFEIYILVSEIHENVDLVLGIKNMLELEGVINSRDCFFF